MRTGTYKARLRAAVLEHGHGSFTLNAMAIRLGVARSHVATAADKLRIDGFIEGCGYGLWHRVPGSRAEPPPRTLAPRLISAPDCGGTIVDRALASRPFMVVVFDSAIAGAAA
jgi:hypothetical protein